MKIGIHDADGNDFPNLALMKLAAYHKALGHQVVKYDALWANTFDKIYSSKVFTFSGSSGAPWGKVERGGTGYKLFNRLPGEVEKQCPDYKLYGKDFSLGFLTRGCPRVCSWCIVNEKEGGIRADSDIEDFLRHDKAILLDNNVLAHAHGIEQIEKIGRMRVKVDFNQGMDARLIDDGIARRLAKISWLEPIRLACDTNEMMHHIGKAVEHLRWQNVTPRRYNCYVLVTDIDSAVERVRFLKGLHLNVYATIFRDYNDFAMITPEQAAFARWVNRSWLFKKCTWEQYRERVFKTEV